MMSGHAARSDLGQPRLPRTTALLDVPRGVAAVASCERQRHRRSPTAGNAMRHVVSALGWVVLVAVVRCLRVDVDAKGMPTGMKRFYLKGRQQIGRTCRAFRRPRCRKCATPPVAAGRVVGSAYPPPAAHSLARQVDKRGVRHVAKTNRQRRGGQLARLHRFDADSVHCFSCLMADAISGALAALGTIEKALVAETIIAALRRSE